MGSKSIKVRNSYGNPLDIFVEGVRVHIPASMPHAGMKSADELHPLDVDLELKCDVQDFLNHTAVKRLLEDGRLELLDNPPEAPTLSQKEAHEPVKVTRKRS